MPMPCPEVYSFSTLQVIERCPLEWCLGQHGTGRGASPPAPPSEAAAEGVIVHELLDELYRHMVIHDLPEAGTDAFRGAMSAFNLMRRLTAKAEAHGLLRQGRPMDVGRSDRLRNQVLLKFRSAYGSIRLRDRDVAFDASVEGSSHPLLVRLQQERVLTEQEFRHPRLPFMGIVDLVGRQAGGTVIVDFKTGKLKEEHRNQLLGYALLWWRVTGDLPSAISVLATDQTWREAVGRLMLERWEARLKARIEEAAGRVASQEVIIGKHCRYCSQRLKCDPWWRDDRPAWDADHFDVEVVATEDSGPYSGEVRTVSGRTLVLTYTAEVGLKIGRWKAGERMRVMGGRARTNTEIEMTILSRRLPSQAGGNDVQEC